MIQGKIDVSMEYAHIYTNNKISKEHDLSLNILGKLQKKLRRDKQSSSLFVLVDDYSFPDTVFDYEKFLAWLSSKGFRPDLVFRESQLIPICDKVLRKLKNKKLREGLVNYIKTRKKYPCSLFISAWYLLRLGYLDHPLFKKKLFAKSLINILPESFKHFENKALEIISSSEFCGTEKLIRHFYY